jgi:hypothetical protein
MADAVRKRREDYLFHEDRDDDAGDWLGDPMAEQEFLAALAHLELAERALRRAGYHQTRAEVASLRSGT